MKTATSQFRDRMKACRKKILSFYQKKTLRKLFLTILILILVPTGLHYLPVLFVKKEAMKRADQRPLSPVKEQIPQDTGEVLVAESDGRQLYVDTEKCILKVKDTAKNLSFSSAVEGAESASELALLNVNYIGEDNKSYQWDSYTYSTEMKTYTMGKIQDGVQMKLSFSQGESAIFYEYLPKKMSIDRFDTFFKGGLETLKTNGSITEDQYSRYLTTLKLVYKKSVKEQCYAVTYKGTPPASAVTQMIDLAKLLGYTQDMLISDSNEFGITVVFQDPAQFSITLEATLVDGELEVRVPTYAIENQNDFYAIQNIEVLPNFGAVTNKQSADGGYMLIPDGSGALMDLNTYTPDVTEYKRPVYDNDFYKHDYFAPEFSDELTMPVFGMTYGKDAASTHGFLGIIEEGADTAYIQTRLANNEDDGPSNNKIYSAFDSVQYYDINVNGVRSESVVYYRVKTNMMDIDYRVKYLLFTEPVTYFDMAKAYQKDLIATHENISEPTYEKGGKLYLDVLGSMSFTKRALGIPYNSVQSMTTYRELEDIMKDLDTSNLVVSYKGAFNKGMNCKMNNKADLVGKNGSKSEYNELMAYAKEKGIDLYLGVDFSRVSAPGNGFNKAMHTVRDYWDEVVPFYRFNLAIGFISGEIGGVTDYNYYNILSPQYLSSVIDGFMKHGKKYDHLYVSDLTSMCYADYDNDDMVDPYQGDRVLQENLSKLTADKQLAINNPWMKNVGYGEIATNISRTSSDYRTFTTTIPFRQLVMNGLIDYTTKDVNMSTDQLQEYILQAVELGAYPKFTITSKNGDVLKNTDYSYYYSIQYDQLKDRIKEVYDTCDQAWSKIGTNEIVNHTILADNVFRTDYASGASVIVNYNLHDVTLEDGTVIAALDYRIQ